ncbi:MAG: hypothetical protein IJN54_03370 [Lachnospiraceae bacterium]|nr:hypothetical protein [Lachnospiraceae bacterium]
MFLKKEGYCENQHPMVDYLNAHYEYCYLESMHYINSIQETTTIITGLSYGLDGLESNLMNGKVLNFSMHSQDLYYDFMHIKRAVLNSQKRITQCIITLGYYSFFYDLSCSSNKWKCLGTYIPLFSDGHHAEFARSSADEAWCNNKEFIRFYHSFFEETGSFYGAAISREHTVLGVTQKGGWLSLNASERDYEAYQLAQKHNNHILHKETYNENIEIFYNMISFLIEHNIRPIVTVLPSSKEYLRYIDPTYKEILMSDLELLPYCIDFIDMNEIDLFTDEDILDSDHLNYFGAIKASVLMDGVINNII